MREIRVIDLHLSRGGGGGGVRGALCFVGESFLKRFNLSRSSEEL